MSYYSEYDETEKDVWPRRRERGRSASPPRRRRSADEREGYLEERQTERYRHDRAEMRVSFSSERERARSPPPPRALRRRRSADHGSPVRRRRSRSPDAREYLQSDRGGSSDAANRPLESLEGMFQVLCPPSFFTPEELRTLEVRSNAKIRMSSEPFPEQSDHVLTIKGSVNGIRTVIGEVLAALFENDADSVRTCRFLIPRRVSIEFIQRTSKIHELMRKCNFLPLSRLHVSEYKEDDTELCVVMICGVDFNQMFVAAQEAYTLLHEMISKGASMQALENPLSATPPSTATKIAPTLDGLLPREHMLKVLYSLGAFTAEAVREIGDKTRTSIQTSSQPFPGTAKHVMVIRGSRGSLESALKDVVSGIWQADSAIAGGPIVSITIPFGLRGALIAEMGEVRKSSPGCHVHVTYFTADGSDEVLALVSSRTAELVLAALAKIYSIMLSRGPVKYTFTGVDYPLRAPEACSAKQKPPDAARETPRTLAPPPRTSDKLSKTWSSHLAPDAFDLIDLQGFGDALSDDGLLRLRRELRKKVLRLAERQTD